MNFDSHHAALLFDALPPLIKVPGASPQAAVLRWALEQLASELRSPGPGGALVSTHLVHLMLVQILRIHLGALSCGAPAGWLSALADPRIGAALGAIHAEPGRGWTLEALARVAGVSRTVRAALQGAGGNHGDELPDALAHAHGGRTAAQRRREHFRHRVFAGL